MADVQSVADDSLAHSETHDEPTTHSMTVSATVGTRRQANGTIGSVYSGNKIRHLKKEDGIPLWRKDIQYQFLKLVFEDKTPVFTRLSDGRRGLDFADIYIDAMARSSKTSKILKDKLQSDKQAAISMAMVCLLVNFGRMNTTLNFFPEMRAQLRTYHSIPSLQAHQDPNAYKQLQDAPRLKSILKGASEDTDQPNTIEKIKRLSIPRTNPVNLIFVLSQYAPKISEMHFFAPRDFFDLVMRSTLSSRSRARAFLWMMWWYLESNFTREAALKNPFGEGLDGEGTGGLPIKVPAFEGLTEAQADEENMDTAEEIQYGEEKRVERKRILEEEEPAPRVTKRSKKSLPEYSYDDDQASGDLSNLASGRGERISLGARGSTASTPLHPGKRLAPDEDDDWNVPSVRGRYKKAKRDSSPNPSSRQRIILKTKMDQTPDTASPAPPGLGHPILNQFVTEPAIPSPNPPSRRPRPLTQHQLAVEQNRRQRIEYLLAQRKVEKYQILRNQRQNEIPSIRYGRLLECLPEDYDTDAESSWGKGGLIPNPKKEEDFGESAHYFLSVIRKAARRLDRWDWENANGPKRDRKKEREERQKAYQNGLGAGGTLNLASSRAASGRSKPSRPKRKVAAPAGASGTSKKQSSNATARTKGNRTSTNRAGAPATATSGRNVKEPSSPSRQRKSPAAPEAEGDESLDDFDKQLLGEGGGHDEEDDRPRRRQTSFAADSDAHDENGYEDSFTGDHGPEGEADEEALSSENEDDHDDDVDDEELDEGEGEGGDVDVDAEIDGDSSASEVGNGYAASESYSENPDVGFDEDVEEMDDYSGEENGVDDEPVEED